MIGTLGKGRVVSQSSQHTESIQLRHHDVGQHQSRPQASRGVERLAPIRDRVHLISTAQQVPEVLAHVRVVIGHDDRFALRRRFR